MSGWSLMFRRLDTLLYRRHKPVHVSWVRGMSEIPAGVSNRSGSAVVLGKGAQVHRRDSAIMVHVVSGVEASCGCVGLAGVALSVWALQAVVQVTGWTWVAEAWMCGGAAGHWPRTWLTLKSSCPQAARTGTIWYPIRTEAATRLLHDLWPLTRQHTGRTGMSYEVIDAEHAGLSRSKAWGWWGGVVGRWQLLAIGRADCHVWVDGVRVCCCSCNLNWREDRTLVDIGVVGAQVTALKPLPAPEEAAALKHVLSVGVQGPVVALPWPPRFSGNLDETIIQCQVMSNWVLPFLWIVSVERKALCDELVDASQGELAVRRVGYGHGDESDVAVRGLPSLQWPLPSASSWLLLRLWRDVGRGQTAVCRRAFLHFDHWHCHFCNNC